jgi:hypothetical protein
MTHAIWVWAACCLSAAGRAAAPPTLDPAGPVERAEVDRYDLVATYEAPVSGAAVLVLEQAEDQGRLVVQATAKRSEIVRVTGRKASRLATGAGFAGGELTVRRRPGVLTACAGPETLVEAHADFTAGDCGAPSGPGIASAGDVRLQEIGEIVLDDDFFVGAEREGLWEDLLGALKIDIYWDPKQKVDNRPIGACWFANDGPGEHLAATGAGFWDDYACEVSVRPDADSTVGLAFRIRDAANYATATLSTDAEGALARVTEVREGQATVLAERRVACRVGQWHRVRAEVVGAEVSAQAAGEALEPVALSTEESGRVGVYAQTQGDCRFDDLSVRGLRRVAPEPKPQPSGAWRFVSGRWKSGRERLDCRAASTAVAVASSGEWLDADVSASVRLPEGAEAGLTARWTGAEGYALLARREAEGLRCRLARISPDGEPETLAEGATPVAEAELRLVAAGAALRGYVGETCVVRAWDARVRAGEVGVVACDGQAGFSRFAASEPPAEDVVSEVLADGCDQSRPGAEHGAFEPFIGQLWRPVAGRAALTDLESEPAVALNAAALRYYCPRPGDVLVATDLLQTDGQAVSLAICEEKAGDTGYRLSLAGEQLALTRNGQTVGQAAGAGPPPLALSLRRDGPFVVGEAGAAVVSFRDPEPLPTGYAVVQAAGRAVIDNLSLGASHALAYRFDRVEPDWIEAGGEWLFHSGMACIPWAYWLSGDGRETPAVVWNRRETPADLSARFDVSEYTVGYESGEHVHYPYHDISLAVCADGESLDSGYRFVIGAEGGRKTRLLRQGQVVAETAEPRFTATMGGHCNNPRAIEVVAEKRGGELRLTLNGALAFEYEDPAPLGPGRVALAVDGCRANFRDLFIYRDETWQSPLGVDRFGPQPSPIPTTLSE